MSVYASGPGEIDFARRELRVSGTPVPIGARAFEVLEILVRASGQLVGKDELMSRIWPGAIAQRQHTSGACFCLAQGARPRANDAED